MNIKTGHRLRLNLHHLVKRVNSEDGQEVPLV